MRHYRIAVIPGDGIGRDVIAEGLAALDLLAEAHGDFRLEAHEFDWSCARYLREGTMMPPDGMRVLTEFQDRALDAVPVRSDPATIVARVPARDPLLDAMAFSKGRFAIEIAGLPTLYAPSWAEVTRVIEDCR